MKRVENPRKAQRKSKKRKAATRKSDTSLDKRDYEKGTVAYMICHVAAIKKRTTAKTTFQSYKTYYRHLIRYCGGNQLVDIMMTDIEEFHEYLLDTGRNAKVVNGCNTALREVFKRAVKNRYIVDDPMSEIHNLSVESASPLPCDENEITKLIRTDTPFIQAKNLLLVGIGVGWRICEGLGITWEMIEFFNDSETGEERARIAIDMANVDGEYKVTKTLGSTRTVTTCATIARILREQEKLTAHKRKRKISIKQRDNRTVIVDYRRPVFFNDKTGEPWLNVKQYQKSFFTGFLKQAGVAHRGPNQLRHTFASQNYTAGVSLAWIAAQLGHKTTAIVEKHYAKTIHTGLEKERKKADKTIASLFTKRDENSIVVPSSVVNKKSVDLKLLQTLADQNKLTATQRETLLKLIDAASPCDTGVRSDDE